LLFRFPKLSKADAAIVALIVVLAALFCGCLCFLRGRRSGKRSVVAVEGVHRGSSIYSTDYSSDSDYDV
jgi:hypothetical protein